MNRLKAERVRDHRIGRSDFQALSPNDSTALCDHLNDILSSVGEHRLNTLFLQAERAGSGRAHLLLHRDASDPVQRLLIALNPGTYIPPQRHPSQWELQLLMFGRIRTVMFDENGH